jgi:folate-binding protein YgfZ
MSQQNKVHMNYQIIKNKAFIKISGADSLKFLQGIMSANVTIGRSTYALLLNPQGRYLSDFFISWVDDNSAILELPIENKDQILAKLRMYKLRSDISLEDISDEYFVVFSDKKIEDAYLSYLDPRFSHDDSDSPNSKCTFTRSIMQKAFEAKFLQNDSEFYNILKYDLPVIEGCDMIYEKSIPIEYGMEKFNAISFTKGCYIGQEVISRTKHTGVVRKKIYLAESEDHIHAKQSDEILINDRKMGKICSVWKNRAIILMNDMMSNDGLYEVNGQRLEII